MFRENDEKYLIRAISQNRVVLFLGAGFSRGVKNKIGSPFPSGTELGAIFWKYMNYDGHYDDTPLPDMYEAVLASGKKTTDISDLLDMHLLCDDVPDRYKSVTRAFWYRIYTTNVDNVLEHVFRSCSSPNLKSIAFPNDDLKERDQTLEYIQAVYLHGKLPCKPDEITFSVRQYADRANRMDPMYDQFVREYATHPTVFIGTQLAEPLFWQYIEARRDRPPRISERRQKSFLICPKISPPKKTQLERFNVVPIERPTDDFFDWLSSIPLPSRTEVLKVVFPDLYHVVRDENQAANLKRARLAFAELFERVPLHPAAHHRSLYLLGASPQWEDLFNDLDAARETTTLVQDSLSQALEHGNGTKVFALLGSAGCGKSTILRRIGLNMSRAGKLVFFSNSEELPKPSDSATALDALSERALLLLDNAEVSLPQLPAMLSQFETIQKPPVILLASRTNEFDRRLARLPKSQKVLEFSIPILIREEIEQIIEILDNKNLLGRLQGMSQSERIKEFEERARKQILVAMREATSGKGFDAIIKDEFEKLEPAETKLLYLCVALGTAAGYRLTKEEFVGCSRVSPAEALHLLERNLKDIVLVTGMYKNSLILRHKKIAEAAISGFSNRLLLQQAYIRLLGVLSAQAVGRHWRTRNFSFYKDIINHVTIFKRFEENINHARTIYDELAGRFKKDPHFWLQYGSLELEAGDLVLAENYIYQAESLDTDNVYIQNAKAHLLLRKGVESTQKSEAVTYRDEGSTILEELILRGDVNDPYCYHIYCNERRNWMRKWEGYDREKQTKELEKIKEILEKGVYNFPRNRRLRELQKSVQEEYLYLAVRTR